MKTHNKNADYEHVAKCKVEVASVIEPLICVDRCHLWPMWLTIVATSRRIPHHSGSDNW